MSNSLLRQWLDDKRDELFPYYFTKLDFLNIYGRRCRTQDKEFKCEEAVDENECIIGKDLYCQYSDGNCSQIIDSICNYYDENGSYIEEEFGKEQVEYLDNLYKTGAVFEYSKTFSNETARQNIKTNAFQKIYSKFTIGYNQNVKCHKEINNLLVTSIPVMSRIHQLRRPIYEKLSGEEYVVAENNNINVLEISMYIFEIIRKKYPIHTFFDSYTNIFIHSNEIDNEILNIINKDKLCLDNKNQTISFDLTKLKKEDFELAKPENSLIYNLLLTGYNTAKNTVFFVGSLILNTTTFLIMNYGKITLIFFSIVMIQQILGLFIDTEGGVKTADWLMKTVGSNEFSKLNDLIQALKPIMPYINVLYTYCRDILCLLMPLISNVHLIHSSLGIVIGNYIAKLEYSGSSNRFIPFEFFSNLKNIAYIEGIVHILKNDFLKCGKTVRAMGPQRNLVYIEDKESNFTRWGQFISEQWESGTTQPLFRDFIQELKQNPLGNVTKLFSILSSIITGNCFKEGAVGDINEIAKQGSSLFVALFIEGPFYQESGVASVSSQILGPVTSTLDTIGKYNFLERFLEISTINTLFYIAVSSGLYIGYTTNSERTTSNAIRKKIENEKKTRKESGGKRKNKKSRKQRKAKEPIKNQKAESKRRR